MGIQTWILLAVMSNYNTVVVKGYGSEAECERAKQVIVQSNFPHFLPSIAMPQSKVICIPGPVETR